MSHIEKRRKCLTDREVALIAVRVFNGERRATIARELGVSGSYLSRLIADAHRRGLVRVVVAEDAGPPASVHSSNFSEPLNEDPDVVGPNGEIYDDVYRRGLAALDDA